jgi:hypothetical protein
VQGDVDHPVQRLVRALRVLSVPPPRSARRPRRPASARWWACVAAAAAAAGCSGATDPGGRPAHGSAHGSAPATNVAGAAPPSAAGSPLDELLGLVQDPADLHRAWVAHAAGYPDAVTACMRGRGWRHFTAPHEPPPTLDELVRSAGDVSDQLAEHGYGLAENVQLQVDNAVADRSAMADEVPAWIRSLSASEEEALQLDSVDCQRRALERFPHPATYVGSSAVLEEVLEVRRAIDGSEDGQALWREWAACMAERGHRAANRSEVVAELNEEATALVSRLEPALRAAPGPLPPDHPVLVDVRSAAARLAARERVLAEDDVACAAPIDLDERLRRIRYRLEQEYVEQHGDELRALMAVGGSG